MRLHVTVVIVAPLWVCSTMTSVTNIALALTNKSDLNPPHNTTRTHTGYGESPERLIADAGTDQR